MSFFQNVRNVDINGGRFFTVNGDYNNISVGSGLCPIQLYVLYYL